PPTTAAGRRTVATAGSLDGVYQPPALDRSLDVERRERGRRTGGDARVEPRDLRVELGERLAQRRLGPRLQRTVELQPDLEGVGEEREVLVPDLLLHPPERVPGSSRPGRGLPAPGKLANSPRFCASAICSSTGFFAIANIP